MRCVFDDLGLTDIIDADEAFVIKDAGYLWDPAGDRIDLDSFFTALVNDVNRLGQDGATILDQACIAGELSERQAKALRGLTSITIEGPRPRLEPGEIKLVEPGEALDEEAIEAMVDAMVKQSTAYPVVPPGYSGKIDRLAALRSRPELAHRLEGNPAEAEQVTA